MSTDSFEVVKAVWIEPCELSTIQTLLSYVDDVADLIRERKFRRPQAFTERTSNRSLHHCSGCSAGEAQPDRRVPSTSGSSRESSRSRSGAVVKMATMLTAWNVVAVCRLLLLTSLLVLTGESRVDRCLYTGHVFTQSLIGLIAVTVSRP